MDIDNKVFIANLLQVYIEEKELVLPKSWLSELIKKNNNSTEVEIIRGKLNTNSKSLEIDDIIHFYMKFYSDKEQKDNGIYYTPTKIVDMMNTYVLKEFHSNKVPNVIDPAVGGGMFIYKIAIMLSEKYKCDVREIIEKNIYGIDIMAENILMSKCVLAIISYENCQKLPVKFNLLEADSLSVTKEIIFEKFAIQLFDIVVTNPPYVRSKHINKKVKENFKNYTNTIFGVPDLYIPFFELGLNLLKEGGLAAYITPNTFFRSLNGKKVRKYLRENTSYFKILNFNSKQLFEDIQSYSAISFFQKKTNNLSETKFYHYSMNEFSFELFPRNWEQFYPIEKWITLNNIEKEIVNKLEKTFENKLENLNIKNGIATQRNSIYSFSYFKEDINYYYFSKDSTTFAIEKDITRPFLLPNTKDKDPRLRIIFPYEISTKHKVVKPISIEKMSEKYPRCLEYLEIFREELTLRKADKNLKYWYLYGRSQGLNLTGNRLYLPYMAKRVKTMLSETDEELFAAGYAIFNDSVKYLEKLSFILESKLFSFYISKVSKPYSNGYYSTAKNMIIDFSVPSEKELLEMENSELTDVNIYDLYKLKKEEKEYINSIDF